MGHFIGKSIRIVDMFSWCFILLFDIKVSIGVLFFTQDGIYYCQLDQNIYHNNSKATEPWNLDSGCIVYQVICYQQTSIARVVKNVLTF